MTRRSIVRRGSGSVRDGAGGRQRGLVDRRLLERRGRERGDRAEQPQVRGVELDRLARDRADDPEPLAADAQRRRDQRGEPALGRGRAWIGRDVVDDLGIAGEDRAEDPGAGIDGRLGIVVAGPDLERTVRPAAEADEPATAGRQTSRLADRDPGDRVGLERRPDLVGQVVDEVELAVAVERLAGERTLVRLAGSRRRSARPRWRPPGAGPRPSRPVCPSMTIGWRSTAASGGRGRGLPVEDDLAVDVGDADARVGGRQHDRQHRRDMAMADDEPTKLGRLHQPVPTPSPSTSRARRRSSSGSNGLVM